MFFRLQLLSINIISTLLLVLFLCLGSQNLEKRYKLNFLINESVQLPVGFLIGASFSLGFLTGGITAISLTTNKRLNIDK